MSRMFAYLLCFNLIFLSSCDTENQDSPNTKSGIISSSTVETSTSSVFIETKTSIVNKINKITIKSPQEIDNNYDGTVKQLLSYKAAKVLYDDLYNCYINQDNYYHSWWLTVSEHWEDEFSDIIRVGLFDMNNDGSGEILFRKYPAGIDGKDCNYILYSTASNTILLNNPLRGDFYLYQIGSNVLLHTLHQVQGFTVMSYFELVNNEYNYGLVTNELQQYYSIDYVDKNIKITSYLDNWKTDANNYYSKYTSGEDEYIYPETYENNTQFENDINNYLIDLEDCTYLLNNSEIILSKDDFKSFESLLKALTPLDNHMKN